MTEPSMSDQLSQSRPASSGPGMLGWGVSRHRRRLLRGAIGLVAGLTAVAASAGLAGASAAPVRPAAVPSADIVGTGLVNCGRVTGEIGFSPATVFNGTAVDVVSIWLQGTACKPARGSATKPLPKTVVLSMSFTTTNVCPQTDVIGGGTANFAYNYPPVPSPMIDPSVAMNVSVTEGPPYTSPGDWRLLGLVNWGSYSASVGPDFQANIRPVVIGRQNCKTGVTSMYVSEGTMINV
jgi:hypothetical protein